MDENFSFGYWLRRQRMARDLRQEDLAAQLGIATITLRKIEADARRPSLQLIDRLAEVFALVAQERETLRRVARADLSPAALPLPERARDADPQVPIAAPTASDLPSSRSGIAVPHNLPVPPNPLIGRERELAALQALLQREDVRLLTLLGPGGSGKTRLALQLAHEQLGSTSGGVWFVDLTPVRDPGQVLPTIARTLGLREHSDQSVVQQLQAYLHEQALLLVLDNLEQVIEAAPELATLLAGAPLLRIVATSREALRLAGEQVYAVPPLAVRASGDTDLLSSPAAQLFIARARAARADFSVDVAGTAAVAAICQRLDGLPLALELAAARTRLLSPQALLARLERPLDVLTVGARDLPTRQQTLRTTIAWSYELLTTAEQRLFRRLGVFVGSWELAAAKAVGALEAETLDLLAALVDKSLVEHAVAVSDEPRYTLLETIREYALEQLAQQDELRDTSERLSAYALALAEAAVPELHSPRGPAWLDRLEADHGTLRAVLQRSSAGKQTERALRLGSALWPFWWRKGYLSEGRAQLQAILGLSQLQPETAEQQRLRAGVLLGAGRLAIDMGDYQVGRGYLEASLTLAQREAAHRCRRVGEQRQPAAGWLLGFVVAALGLGLGAPAHAANPKEVHRQNFLLLR